MSADRNEWRTTPELFDAVNRAFRFNVDLAASDENHLCEKYFTAKSSAFLCYTQDVIGEVWCNPPYGKESAGQAGLLAWAKLCWRISHRETGRVVMLAPGDHGTQWYKWALDHCAIEIRLSPRVQFLPPDGVKPSSNPHPSTLFVFDGTNWPWHHSVLWNWKEEPLAECLGFKHSPIPL